VVALKDQDFEILKEEERDIFTFIEAITKGSVNLTGCLLIVGGKILSIQDR